MLAKVSRNSCSLSVVFFLLWYLERFYLYSRNAFLQSFFASWDISNFTVTSDPVPQNNWSGNCFTCMGCDGIFCGSWDWNVEGHTQKVKCAMDWCQDTLLTGKPIQSLSQTSPTNLWRVIRALWIAFFLRPLVLSFECVTTIALTILWVERISL